MSTGLILIGASLAQLEGWIAPTPGERRRLSSPEGLGTTWLVTAGERTREWITGGRSTVAVRVTQHPVAAGLCLASGLPLVSTSANRRGKKPARSPVAVRCRFGQSLDLVVGGPLGKHRGPTEIRDGATGRVVRPG